MDEFQYRAVENGVGDDLGSLGMSDEVARDFVNALHYASASSQVRPGEHAPIPGDEHQETRIHNDYGRSPMESAMTEALSLALRERMVMEARERFEREVLNVPIELPFSSQSDFGRPPIAAAASDLVSLNQIMERLANRVGSQGSVQVDNERESMVPPRRNHYSPHGYEDRVPIELTPEYVLFWNGPYHKQFLPIRELTSTLMLEDPSYEPPVFTADAGLTQISGRRERYPYRLMRLGYSDYRVFYYILHGTSSRPDEIERFFRSLESVYHDYLFIINPGQHSAQRDYRNRERSMREEIYQEVLERVRREVAERERRNTPPPSPQSVILPSSDVDKGRSIEL